MSSKNRLKYVTVTTALKVDNEAYRKFPIDKLFPAARTKIPLRSSRAFIIQQGNVKPQSYRNNKGVQ